MEQLVGKTVDGSEWTLRVRVQLVDSEPEIWRLLELPGSLPLGRVHNVLQTAFGWQDAHLHRFTASDPYAPLRPVHGEIPEALQWIPAELREESTDLAEDDCSLDQLLVRGSGAAFYEYNFGDSWVHRLELATRRPADATNRTVRLVDGARRAPLEDSGGFPGFEQILDVLADPSHKDHVAFSAWVADVTGAAGPFDPGFLDITAVNRALSGCF